MILYVKRHVVRVNKYLILSYLIENVVTHILRYFWILVSVGKYYYYFTLEQVKPSSEYVEYTKRCNLCITKHS